MPDMLEHWVQFNPDSPPESDGYYAYLTADTPGFPVITYGCTWA